MRRIVHFSIIFFAMATFGCAEIPRESVQLSVTLGRDLNEVHRAHRELVTKYFGDIKTDINDFIDYTYRPFMIKRSMLEFALIDRLKNAEAPGNELDSLDIMEIYVTEVTEQIESFRNELLKNISDQENEVITAIDESYQKLQNANSIITGHLASVRKVKDAQEEFIERAGLENLRKKFIDNAINLSDRVSHLTGEARKIQKEIDKKEPSIDEIANKVEDVSKRLKETIKNFEFK